jgi:hypothetical protein
VIVVVCELASRGVRQLDFQPRNFVLTVDGNVMAIDLEEVSIRAAPSQDWVDETVAWACDLVESDSG